jgi:polyhydroxyalkanoate synthesis repressor PhaR
MARPRKKPDDVIIVKKYANRRLYDTGKSSYVTLEDLAEMIREGLDFKVIDAKSEKDLTQSVLTQIIVEQESKDDGASLLPQNFLKEIIKFYGGNMEAFVPTYLEQAMKNFVDSQEKMREQMEQSFGTMMPMNSMPSSEQMQEMTQRNVEIMQKTMQMFTPFGNAYEEADKNEKKND